MPGFDKDMNRREFMKTAAITAGALGLGAVSMIGHTGCSDSSSSSGSLVLARVEVPEYLEDLNLPVYADMEDGDEVYYALVIASMNQLNAAGVSYRVLDDYRPGIRYLIAWEDEDADREEAAKIVPVLYDDGEHIIVRYRPELSELLPELGFVLKIISSTPINYTAEEEAAARTLAPMAVDKHAKIEAMINAVSEDRIRSLLEVLSGEKEVLMKDKLVRFTTRHTSSGEPVEKATQYVYEQLKDLNPYFQDWASEFEDYPLKNRNVVGEITGQKNPEEIIILIAHLDSITNDKNGLSPGADDNGSGCVALLMAAEIMKDYQFRKTIRFVFTTGEEQSLFGGEHHAERAKTQNQKIAAVINLDMIAYCKKFNDQGKLQQQVKTRHHKNRTGYAKDEPIANTYLDVVKVYGLNAVLDAFIEDDGEPTSDHSPFWDRKYAAIWVIEYAEKGFLNPKMHTKNDKIGDDTGKDYLDFSYLAATVKASLGTAAHLAEVMN